MTQKQSEQRALLVGITVNIIMAVAGLAVYSITHIQALFLDATFTLINVLSGIAAIYISRKSTKTSATFPNGYFALEPLYGVFKTLLTLLLIAFSTVTVSVSAYNFFVHDIGNKMDLGPVIPYELLMITMSFLLAWYYRIQYTKTSNTSTMLKAEMKATVMDGIMSTGICIAALLLFFISEDGPFGFLLYTGDFFITILLILFSIKEPIKILRDSFIELLHGVVTSKHIIEPIEKALVNNLPPHTSITNLRIQKVGMSFQIFVRLHSKFNTFIVRELDEKARQIKQDLSKLYQNISIHFVLNELE